MYNHVKMSGTMLNNTYVRTYMKLMSYKSLGSPQKLKQRLYLTKYYEMVAVDSLTKVSKLCPL